MKNIIDYIRSCGVVCMMVKDYKFSTSRYEHILPENTDIIADICKQLTSASVYRSITAWKKSDNTFALAVRPKSGWSYCLYLPFRLIDTIPQEVDNLLVEYTVRFDRSFLRIEEEVCMTKKEAIEKFMCLTVPYPDGDSFFTRKGEVGIVDYVCFPVKSSTKVELK